MCVHIVYLVQVYSKTTYHIIYLYIGIYKSNKWISFDLVGYSNPNIEQSRPVSFHFCHVIFTRLPPGYCSSAKRQDDTGTSHDTSEIRLPCGWWGHLGYGGYIVGPWVPGFGWSQAHGEWPPQGNAATTLLHVTTAVHENHLYWTQNTISWVNYSKSLT